MSDKPVKADGVAGDGTDKINPLKKRMKLVYAIKESGFLRRRARKVLNFDCTVTSVHQAVQAVKETLKTKGAASTALKHAHIYVGNRWAAEIMYESPFMVVKAVHPIFESVTPELVYDAGQVEATLACHEAKARAKELQKHYQYMHFNQVTAALRLALTRADVSKYVRDENREEFEKKALPLLAPFDPTTFDVTCGHAVNLSCDIPDSRSIEVNAFVKWDPDSGKFNFTYNVGYSSTLERVWSAARVKGMKAYIELINAVAHLGAAFDEVYDSQVEKAPTIDKLTASILAEMGRDTRGVPVQIEAQVAE